MAGRPFVNFRHLSVRPRELLSTSVNLLYSQENFCEILSTFGAARRHSVNFQQLSEQPGDPPTTSVNFLCCRENFRQLPSTFHAARGISINFCQLYMQPGELLSNFRAAGRPSVSFRQLSVGAVELPSTSVNFHAATSPSVNFPYHRLTVGNIPCGRETLSHLASAFHAAGRSSVRFRQLSVWPVDLSSISVNLLCC